MLLPCSVLPCRPAAATPLSPQCLKPDAPAPTNEALPKCIAAFVGDCCTNTGLAAGAACGFGGVRKVVSSSPRVVETAGIVSTRCTC